jgi:hypothetical protein
MPLTLPSPTGRGNDAPPKAKYLEYHLCVLRILRIIGGVLLVIIGIAALVTPLTPGAWLGLIGLELLGFGFLIPKKIRRLWKKEVPPVIEK